MGVETKSLKRDEEVVVDNDNNGDFGEDEKRETEYAAASSATISVITELFYFLGRD